MASIQLEFRGIRLEHLIEYFNELGGTQSNKLFPIHVQGNGWQCSILNDEEIKITSGFFVNSVQIIFRAESEEVLNSLLTNFRKKTTRVGG